MNDMQNLIYTPQPDITIYELALVFKLFTFFTLPEHLKTSDYLMKMYFELPDHAKRHFTIMEDPK